jgi:hypothetical protein
VGGTPRAAAPSIETQGSQMSVRTLLTALILATGLCAGCAQTDERTVLDRTPSSAPADVDVIEERWPGGELRSRREGIRALDGTLVNHGTFARWYPDGQKEYEAVFVNGKLHGSVTRWHQNGRRWIVAQYDHGSRHGSRRVWDDQGRLRKEEHFKNGAAHGTWTVWDGDGVVKSQQEFD